MNTPKAKTSTEGRNLIPTRMVNAPPEKGFEAWTDPALLKQWFAPLLWEEINKIKKEAGKDIVIFGSGSIVSQLTKLGLIDEYKFLINPIFLSNGKPIFKNEEAKAKPKYLNSKTFGNGNIMLQYAA